MGFFKRLNDLFSGNKEIKRPPVVSVPQQAPKPRPQQSTKPYTAEVREIALNRLPYIPISNQIVYVESEYDAEANSFIKEHYLEICSLFQKYNYEFCYLPYIVKQIEENRTYYAPQHKEFGKIGITSNYPIKNAPTVVKPSLLYYDSSFVSGKDPNQPVCKLVAIDLTQCLSCDFDEILRFIKRDIYESQSKETPTVRYSLQELSSACADFDFYDVSRGCYRSVVEYVKAEYPDEETKRLIREIEERVLRLEQRGIGKHILQQIISSPGSISRMIITRDYRIILSDYNDMEIEMTPLVKAVYLLFLRHPEGIIFKNLYDYREELTTIYQQVKGERLNLKMRRSINNITDPTNNSINEKVARIREAFVTRFDEHLATHYIIHGERGTAKHIPLNREFVMWQ